MLLSAQSFPEAAKELELAVRYAPRFAEAHLNLGRPDQARAAYLAALRVHADSSEARF